MFARAECRRFTSDGVDVADASQKNVSGMPLPSGIPDCHVCCAIDPSRCTATMRSRDCTMKTIGCEPSRCRGGTKQRIDVGFAITAGRQTSPVSRGGCGRR